MHDSVEFQKDGYFYQFYDSKLTVNHETDRIRKNNPFLLSKILNWVSKKL